MAIHLDPLNQPCVVKADWTDAHTIVAHLNPYWPQTDMQVN